MNRKFKTSFKIQAVEKVLTHNEHKALSAIANSLNIALSTLTKWMLKVKKNKGLRQFHIEKSQV